MSAKAIAVKSKVVDELKEKISRSNLVVITDYLGYSVKQMTELRKKLRAEDAEMTVVKNTLIERAVVASGLDDLKGHLKGPTVVVLGYKDTVTPLKVLVKFVKDAEKGAIRVGAVDKKVFGSKDLEAISKLPSREILIAKVVGGLQSPISGFVNVLQGPVRKLVYALDAIKAKKGGE